MKELHQRTESTSHLHQKIRNLEREVEDLKKQCTQANKLALLGETTAMLAHELINPLTIIDSCSFVVESSLDDESEVPRDFIRKQITSINSAVSRINKLMKNILKMSHGQHQIMKKFSVTDSILTSIEMMSSHMKTKNIKIIYEGCGHEIHSLGDGGQMIQVILNLLTNARDAILEIEGFVSGKIKIKEYVIQGNMAEIHVEDNGIGIKEEERDKIFNSFYTTKDPVKGTGLGLPIVEKIIESFEGTITCKSTFNKGSVFVIRLPIIK